MSEDRPTRLRRLRMRSMRRGIKEMDLILGQFAARELESMSDAELDVFEDVLSQNDHELYAWVSGTDTPPERIAAMLSRIGTSFSPE